MTTSNLSENFSFSENVDFLKLEKVGYLARNRGSCRQTNPIQYNVNRDQFGRVLSTAEKNWEGNMKKLILCDFRRDAIDALNLAFQNTQGVEVRQKDITKVACDAIATAGNSFGDMGGGVDKAIDDASGGTYQKLVEAKIREEYFGELPVGSAILVQRPGQKGTLIYAPTMRVPGKIAGTIHPYLAMRAILITALRHSMETIACVSLGTGVGGIPPTDAAEQMAHAYRLIVQDEWKTVQHPLQAPYVMKGQ